MTIVVSGNRNLILRFAATASLLMLLAGCARSAAFRRDADFDEEAAGSRYYESADKEKRSPTQRLTQLDNRVSEW